MDPDFAQRRRIAVALAITVIAVPAVVLLNRSADDVGTQGPPVTLVGTVPPAGGPPPATADADGETTGDGSGAPSATDILGTVPTGYLDGTVPSGDRDPARIAVPRLPRSTSGLAIFRRDINDVTACKVRNVPFMSTVTVTNLDNSRSVQCIASIAGARERHEVVLSVEAFMQIADLTDAPVPVQVTW